MVVGGEGPPHARVGAGVCGGEYVVGQGISLVNSRCGGRCREYGYHIEEVDILEAGVLFEGEVKWSNPWGEGGEVKWTSPWGEGCLRR